MNDRLAVAPQYLLPKRLVTEVAGRFAGAPRGELTLSAIRRFIARYRVDMSEAVNPDPASYATFNDFFTRALKDDARPLADADFLSPVDGAISQFGPIARGQLFQAKGHTYSAQALLAGSAAEAADYEHGAFATLYLSPRDYHRIHMPCAGELQAMVYVPGELFSVNPTTARGVPGLFARNERVVCHFDTVRGPMALVLVGATIVGSMATVWHGVVNPPRLSKVTRWDYEPGAVRLAKGAEMGRFLLGSTVVLLWPANTIRFNPAWQPGDAIRMGQAMGVAID
ncbi:phosphatidylserine decarboxylase [Comamonas serinivorans]|uniref:Phosphatidylserine decarboxylase proenzyme n=1 Tax=Comamonas serinivorans TaxID=1082851 RepID=A0A1Y0EJ84_9BURK|nr:archaetidylserine decarboxylase [Comamonas serinivorans]ARU03332.1 phosphatidylserine decarboxylase [Comamonas serinivorans]